ncbi:PKD domain-containing protein [Pontibacter mangrovi]|uniref:PKD domain-containing protein n=1 Tax=Pontibacter mangrovi TaxID=2589816 RepID=A0A501W5B8_9BACT|nr:PKD domain-containing protein [Pontibacter mangrovi]TPE43470.1 PKD domain-containing protein [Pontibacter mangrovi]
MKYNRFRTSLHTFLAMGLLAGVMTACTPDESASGLGPAPSAEMVQFTATPNADNANIMTFTNQTPGAFRAVWDLGNGSVQEGQQVEGSYAMEGDYTVKLTVFTSGGYAISSKTIQIDQTDYSMLDREDFNFLTGGADALEGKTWVFSPVGPMNFGGPPEAPSSWWSQTLDAQNDCMKDDKYVFKLEGFAFENQSGGAMWGVEDGAENVCATHTPVASTWSLYEENGKTMLSVSNGETIAWADGEGTYEVMELTENRLHIRKVCCGGSGVRNYVLVPEGYAPPVEPRQVQAIELEDTFEAEGNVTWKKENLTLNESYDNPAPVPINDSPKVAMYVKQAGQAYEFANMFADFDYNFDLTQNGIIKLKVLIPGYNDFTTAQGEDWAIKNLLPQVSVKLQDGTAAEPWANQVEIKQQVAPAQYDKWVELSFDFSAFAERKDLNRIVIQIGGEGNFIPGIFFIDDIQAVTE